MPRESDEFLAVQKRIGEKFGLEKLERIQKKDMWYNFSATKARMNDPEVLGQIYCKIDRIFSDKIRNVSRYQR